MFFIKLFVIMLIKLAQPKTIKIAGLIGSEKTISHDKDVLWFDVNNLSTYLFASDPIQRDKNISKNISVPYMLFLVCIILYLFNFMFKIWNDLFAFKFSLNCFVNKTA